MGPIATRRLLRRLRARALGAALLLAVAAAVVVHHAEPMGSMGPGHHDAPMAAMELCVGAFVLVGAAVVAVARGVVRLGRWRPVACLAPTAQALLADVPAAVPRAGPRLLELLCVRRR